MDRIRILFVDDEAIVREGLKKCIDWEVNGFEVVGAAENGEKALAYLGQLSVNIVVTDIKMPVMDGLELIRNSRESGYDSKFLILSGYDDFQYAQRALRYGADDYITKPFKPSLLYAKCLALLKRNKKIETNQLQSGKVILDLDKHVLVIEENDIALTDKEFKLLRYLMKNQGIVLSREKILDALWGYDYYGDGRAVDTYIKRLRKRLGEYSCYIQTVVKTGYIWKGEES